MNGVLKRVSLALFSIFLVSVVINPSPAFASKGSILERFKKPMPEIPDMDQEEFIKNTKPVSKTPNGDEALAYSMRIPKDWTEREDYSSPNFVLNENLFLDLNVYYGKPTFMGRSRIEVQALKINSNLTIEQWYLKFILEGGYAMEGFVAHTPDKVESFMVVMEGDYSFYQRTLVTVNGDKIILVKYFIPVAFIQQAASMQQEIIRSFKLTNPTPRELPKMQIYRFLDVAEMAYPENWKVFTGDKDSVDRMLVSILNLGEGANKASASTLGRVDVNVVSTSVQPDLLEQIKDYKKEVEAGGLLVGEKIEESYEFTYDNDMEFAITEVYEALDSTSNLSDYEIWFSVFVGGNYYYFLMMLTPSRNENFGVWADNTQNYKQMVKRFQPLSGAFIERD